MIRFHILVRSPNGMVLSLGAVCSPGPGDKASEYPRCRWEAAEHIAT